MSAEDPVKELDVKFKEACARISAENEKSLSCDTEIQKLKEAVEMYKAELLPHQEELTRLQQTYGQLKSKSEDIVVC